MLDALTRVGTCVPCQIGVEVQPLPAQQSCARCDAKERIPVDCGLPAKIQVHRGYYRPEGVPPTVSLVSTDGSACKHACIGIYDDDTCNTCGSVGRPPTMAVACPWGTKAPTMALTLALAPTLACLANTAASLGFIRLQSSPDVELGLGLGVGSALGLGLG